MSPLMQLKRMETNVKKILFASLIALSATTAMAADAISEPPAPPVAEDVAPAFTWSGPYFGIQGGAGWLDGKFSALGATASDNFDGGRLGGFAGYQHQFANNFVLGLEGDVSYDWNDNEYLGLLKVGTDVGGSVRVRAGYAIDNALLYATGGWAVTRGYAKVAGVKETETFNGYTLGAGVDYAFTNNIFARVEYRFTDYSKKTFLNVLDTDLKQNAVTVGLGVKF